MMVGRLLSFWDGKNSGSILNFQGVPYNCPHSTQKIISCYIWNNLRRLSQLRSETKSPWHQVQSLWRSKPPRDTLCASDILFFFQSLSSGGPCLSGPLQKKAEKQGFSVSKKTPLQCQAKICRNDSPTAAGYGPGYKGEGDKIWDVKIAEAKRETKRAIHYLVQGLWLGFDCPVYKLGQIVPLHTLKQTDRTCQEKLIFQLQGCKWVTCPLPRPREIHTYVEFVILCSFHPKELLAHQGVLVIFLQKLGGVLVPDTKLSKNTLLSLVSWIILGDWVRLKIKTVYTQPLPCVLYMYIVYTKQYGFWSLTYFVCC